MTKAKPPYVFTCARCGNTCTSKYHKGQTMCPTCVYASKRAHPTGPYTYTCTCCGNTITQQQNRGATICKKCRRSKKPGDQEAYRAKRSSAKMCACGALIYATSETCKSCATKIARAAKAEKAVKKVAPQKYCACGKPIVQTSERCRSCAVAAAHTGKKYKAETFVCQRCHNTFRLSGSIACQKYCRACAHDKELEDMRERNAARRVCSKCGGKIVREGDICAKCGKPAPKDKAPKRIEFTLQHDIADLPRGARFNKYEIGYLCRKILHASAWIPDGSEWKDTTGQNWRVKNGRFEVIE